MRVRINADECTGCEECVEALEDVFEMAEGGDIARVKMEIIPSELEDEVKDVADECPAEAIIVE